MEWTALLGGLAAQAFVQFALPYLTHAGATNPVIGFLVGVGAQMFAHLTPQLGKK